MSAPFRQHGPDSPDWPVILSVPHAGRDYPADLPDDCRFPVSRLLPLEDRMADLLAVDALAAGLSGLIAHTPRAFIDLNRAERDMDPGMLTAPMAPPPILSAKARGGLGLVPRRTAALGEIWRRRFSPQEIAARIERHHRPYHDQLATLLMAAKRRHGAALLLDIHSMPPLPSDGDAPPPQIVIGDRFGRSADRVLSAIAGACFEAEGLRVAFNAPYAGGHILDRHSAPHLGLHALQIEVDRRLYLDTALDSAGPGAPHMAATLHRVAMQLSESILDLAVPVAAE